MTIDPICLQKMLLAEVMFRCPKDTRNLVNTTGSKVTGDGSSYIFIGGRPASYMPFTNEPWVSPKWKGRVNPNQGWWNKAIRSVLSIYDCPDITIAYTSEK